MKVAKWGNSLAVRLPQSVVEVLELKEGDSIDITVADSREFLISRSLTRKDLIAKLRRYRGRLPADFKFDRADAYARG
jgi:antitoxin MazE